MIQIVPYNPLWPIQFQAEAAILSRQLGPLALRIAHVGSTAVPNMAAKPVIDIQISVHSLQQPAQFLLPLKNLDYHFISLGDFDQVYPFFSKPNSWPSTHHVHLCVAGSEQERLHLAFRDYLREHDDVATEYVALKKLLASKNHGETLESRERYSMSKSDFVKSVLQKAVAEGYPKTFNQAE